MEAPFYFWPMFPFYILWKWENGPIAKNEGIVSTSIILIEFNPFHLDVPFWSPWKHQKIKVFLMFSADQKGTLRGKGLNQLIKYYELINSILLKTIGDSIISGGIQVYLILNWIYLTHFWKMFPFYIYPLWFSGVFTGCKMGALARNGLILAEDVHLGTGYINVKASII